MTQPPFDPTKVTLTIDADGNWRHEGVRITHERTLKLFWSALDVDDQGRFFLQIGPEKAMVEVEDAPFLVTALRLVGNEIRFTLNDDSHEILDPATLRINEKNIPYCKIRGGKMDAKFTRTAYYELAEMIVEHRGGFSLKIGDRLYPVNTEGA